MDFATLYPQMQVTMMDFGGVVNVASTLLPKAKPKNLSLVPGNILNAVLACHFHILLYFIF